MPISCTTAMDINKTEQVGQVLGQAMETLEKAKNAIQKVRDSGNIEAADILNQDYEEQMELCRKLMERNDRWESDSKQGIQNAPNVLEYLGLSLSTDDPEDDHLEPLVFDENDPIQKKIMTYADSLIGSAVAFVQILFELIEETELLSLAIKYERLEKQRKRIQGLQNRQGSTVTLDTFTRLYCLDAHDYFDTASHIIDKAAERNPHVRVELEEADMEEWRRCMDTMLESIQRDQSGGLKLGEVG
ncbi:hypothetical protein H0H93_005133, partial [Arthromyces matolae]